MFSFSESANQLGKGLYSVLGIVLLFILFTGQALALPSVCERLAQREPLARPTTAITTDDAITYVEAGHGLSAGARELLYAQLQSGDTYSPYMVTGGLLDLVKVLIVTEKAGLALERGNTLEALCYVLAQGANFALRDSLSSSLSGVFGTASVAALPIEISLEAFVSAADVAAWSVQTQLYSSARRLGYSHNQILNQTSGDDLFFDGRGWLLMAGDYCAFWGCGPQSISRIPVTGSSPAEVYGVMQREYDAVQVANQRRQEQETIVATIVGRLEPGIQVTPRYPDWVDEVSFIATGELIQGLADNAYLWDFGDGNSASGRNVRHFYRQPGSYNAVLRVADRNGNDQTISRYVQTSPPQIDASAPEGWDALQRSFSTPSSGLVTNYTWSFDDGTPPVAGADQRTVSHEFASSGNHQVQLQLTLDDSSVVSSIWSGHVGPGIRYVRGHTVYGREVWLGGEYIVEGSMTVAEGATLEIQPGAQVRFQSGGSMYISGTLLADGATFTASDVDNPWRGIVMYGQGANASQLRNCVIEHARGVNWASNESPDTAVLYLFATAPLISGCTLRNSPQALSGVTINNGSATTLSNNTITGFMLAGAAGVDVDNNSFFPGSAPTVSGNTVTGNAIGIRVSSRGLGLYRNNVFAGNNEHGFLYSGTTVLDAAGSFWGHVSGPLDTSDDRPTGGWYNPNGRGNRVSDQVAYRPWLSSPDGDLDHDGIPDATDPDDDNDGAPDAQDAFPWDPHESLDTDGDGIGNNADLDDDNDGIPDTRDNCPLVANANQADDDRDGIGDACDSTPRFCWECLPGRGGWRAVLPK